MTGLQQGNAESRTRFVIDEYEQVTGKRPRRIMISRLALFELANDYFHSSRALDEGAVQAVNFDVYSKQFPLNPLYFDDCMIVPADVPGYFIMAG